jgi:AcrR family transcriptional regulator
MPLQGKRFHGARAGKISVQCPDHRRDLRPAAGCLAAQATIPALRRYSRFDGSPESLKRLLLSRPKEVTDDQIIEAARRVFLEQGAQTPIAVVASELGVSSTALHLRMGSKKALLLRALCPTDPPVLQQLADDLDEATPVAKQLRDILLQLQTWTEAEIPATFTLYSIGLLPEPGDEIENSQPARLRRALRGWLRRAARVRRMSCPPRVAAEILLGVLEARALHAFITRRPSCVRDSRAFIRELVATVFLENVD